MCKVIGSTDRIVVCALGTIFHRPKLMTRITINFKFHRVNNRLWVKIIQITSFKFSNSVYYVSGLQSWGNQ